MNKQFLLKLNIQYFSEEGATEGAVESAPTEPEFKAPSSQSELDSIVNKAVQTALNNQKSKSEDDFQKRVEAEIKKREDYAKLSETQKRDRDFEERQNKFNEEVAAFKQSQLIMEVKEDLLSKNLPVELAETFAKHGTAEEALKAVTVLERAFQDAVANAVKASARQTTPGASGTGFGKQMNIGQRLAKGVNHKKPF
nr:MAG TPA: Major capsid protein [Caudoviricetes sp.]